MSEGRHALCITSDQPFQEIVMKTFLGACLTAGAMLFASADSAQAQYYYGGYSPYYGSSYYGGLGTRTFSYGTTLPGGSAYGYSYVQPNYNSGGYGGPGYGYVNPNGGFSSSAYGYSYPAPYVAYPSYGYRPGYYSFFYR